MATPAKPPIEILFQARQQLTELTSRQKISIGVIGGGPAAAEVAGNIQALTQQSKYPPLITIFAGRKLMPRFHEGVRKMVRQSLTRRSIKIVEEGYIDKIEAEDEAFEPLD